jgi:hypothetical protein
MRNKSKIKGNNNSVYQEVNDSKISTLNSMPETKNNYSIIGIVIAILTLLISIIIGWDNIENFFTK